MSRTDTNETPTAVASMPSTALRTDHYELTMVRAALQSGVAGRRAVFQVFARQLPEGRRYGVVGGTGRLADAVAAFRFGEAEVSFLQDRGFLDATTVEWLAGYRFQGTIDAYREGELYFPYSPVVTVEAPFAEALVLETLVLSILNYDSAVASAAARMVDAAGDRPLIEGGGRRTNEEAAVAAARAAFVAGFAVTSNLEAGRRFGLPTAGTAAHAFTLAHGDERAAFAAQLAAFGPATTYLVDTFDLADGIRNAVELAGPSLGAIRIDSGDLPQRAVEARALLDELGANATAIVVSGDLDEHRIAELRNAPIDRMLVGTRVVTGSGHPAAGMVYKLVAIAGGDGPGAPLRSVEKRSPGKLAPGERKYAYRVIDGDGFASEELVTTDPLPAGVVGRRPLQVRLLDAGSPSWSATAAESRAHCLAARAELRPEARSLSDGSPALDATPSHYSPSDRSQ